MPFLFFLKELQQRLFYVIFCFGLNCFISFFYSEQVFYILIKPFLKVIKNSDNFSENRGYFIFTNLTDGFLINLKIILLFSFLVSLPFIFFQAWSFLVPGLFDYEKTFLKKIFQVSFFLYLFSIFLSFFFIIPRIWNFFLGFEVSIELFGSYFEGRLTEYFDLICDFYLYIFAIFQIPLFFIILLWFGVISIDFFIRNRKIIYLLFLIAGALITPPDVISQLLLFLAFFVLFETFIFMYLFYLSYVNFKHLKKEKCNS